MNSKWGDGDELICNDDNYEEIKRFIKRMSCMCTSINL